jgi:HSP20 family protein
MNIIPWRRHESDLSTRGDGDLDEFWNSFFSPYPWQSGQWPTRMRLPEPFRGRGSPPMNISESENHFAITMELPGLDTKDVNIELMGNQLVVSGERKWDDEKKGKEFHRVESQYGTFSRTISLPDNVRVDRDSIEATFSRGILEIRIPKSEPTPAAKIQIRSK